MSEPRGLLLNVLQRVRGRRKHLADEDLLSLVERAAGHPHLESCGSCAARHAELLCLFSELDGLHVEADAAFDVERLAHQRAHILRRLERNHGPARVLRFPAAAEAARGLGLIGGSGRRWVAAAAIGGLLVGIFSGRFLTHRPADAGPGFPAAPAYQEASRMPRSASQPSIVPADLRGLAGDEILYDEVETALARQPVTELTAIDAITPAARD